MFQFFNFINFYIVNRTQYALTRIRFKIKQLFKTILDNWLDIGQGVLNSLKLHEYLLSRVGSNETFYCFRSQPLKKS